MTSYTDPELRGPEGLHVTPAGQVLICGSWSCTILQLDCEGRTKLVILAARERDVVKNPLSVWYSGITSSIIVWQAENNILVFRVK
ncbi:hypothetical protein DPMN_104049 [Dreissena polymorpha]|uniref:Uncharacterized protein n=1 Tax=Dreissena polymorpha TaxID=45954 RepID=A0A9D4K0S6_DREPO|nr:hypothetical protein DPMN_104049 [Dreissena polymorpha]